MSIPRVSLVAYNDRFNRFIFVAVPNERARYIRTDACVAMVPCHYCGALVGEPCRRMFNGVWRYCGGTHTARRAIYRRHWSGSSRPDDVLETLDETDVEFSG